MGAVSCWNSIAENSTCGKAVQYKRQRVRVKSDMKGAGKKRFGRRARQHSCSAAKWSNEKIGAIPVVVKKYY